MFNNLIHMIHNHNSKLNKSIFILNLGWPSACFYNGQSAKCPFPVFAQTCPVIEISLTRISKICDKLHKNKQISA